MMLQIDSTSHNISLALAERKLLALESHFSDEDLLFLHQTDLSHINFFVP